MAGEAKLQDLILKDLRYLGKNVECFKIKSASDNGVPDIFFTTIKTGPVFVEVKDKEKKPRKIQQSIINSINDNGCKAYSCDSWESWVALKRVVGLD